MDTQLLIAQGNEYRAQNQPTEALKCYAQAFVEDMDLAAAWNNYGNVMRECGQPARAIPFLQHAIVLEPQNVTAHFNLAVSYLIQGPGIDFSKGDLELRKVSHKALSDISFAVESFRFNVVVARIMELVNAARKAIDSGVGPSDAAVREAVEIVAISLSLIAPYTAEEMWEVLGHQPSVARAGWPSVDPQLLTQDSVTAIFQINGKIKSRVEVSPDIADEALEKMALSDPAIVSDLGGVNPKKVITKAPKFVNIVL